MKTLASEVIVKCEAVWDLKGLKQAIGRDFPRYHATEHLSILGPTLLGPTLFVEATSCEIWRSNSEGGTMSGDRSDPICRFIGDPV